MHPLAVRDCVERNRVAKVHVHAIELDEIIGRNCRQRWLQVLAAMRDRGESVCLTR